MELITYIHVGHFHDLHFQSTLCYVRLPISYFEIKIKCHFNFNRQHKLVSSLEFNVPFQHKYGYIRDEAT